ncbi:MAG: hypothetical protein PHQ19_03180, partial [Candidatus Krumholzibacteria bacterium]|nr:hypothetical protein [Candidatus Krumholzibacteria bacterium]
MTESVLETLPSVHRKFKDFVSGLARLLMQRNLFPASHPSVGKALDAVAGALAGLTGDAGPVTIRRAGSMVCHLNFEIDTAAANGNELHMLRKALDTLSVHEMEFGPGTER